jgi:hypothetical protein
MKRTPRSTYEQFFKAEVLLHRALQHLRDKDHLLCSYGGDTAHVYRDAAGLVEEAIGDLMDRHTLLLMEAK